ncbi:hypothetical protein L873DRAFT_1792405 [Choiromyces venosus 120613-1]|uniref:YMC020W-like alpha/beta hydrolase domain-containing protein n=1 Tax=Choiromyces venosus 120613-1 TaxID=1336337 RepID=A0A3N4JD62_9PEZI|nr:hypothetical protein L873DRAFT_1792405 [Choiromyces venosus 120613-1]
MTKDEKKGRPPPSPKLAASPLDPTSLAISTVHASGVPSSLPPSESNLRSTSQISLVSPDVTPSPPTRSFSSMEPKMAGVCKSNKPSYAEPPKVSSKGWFSRTGTWSRSGGTKSAAITKVASENVSREPNISSGSNITEETSVPVPKIGQPEPLPSTQEQTSEPPQESAPSPPQVPLAPPPVPTNSSANTLPTAEPVPTQPEPQASPSTEFTSDANNSQDSKDSLDPGPTNESSEQPASYWFGWWYGRQTVVEQPVPKSEFIGEIPEESPVVEIEDPAKIAPGPLETQRPLTMHLQIQTTSATQLIVTVEPQESMAEVAPPADGSGDDVTAPRPKSWFGWWGGQYQELPVDPQGGNGSENGEASHSECATDQTLSQPRAVPGAESSVSLEVPPKHADHSQNSSNSATPLSQTPEALQAIPKTSTWAFWSRERLKPSDNSPNSSSTTVGELAVADTAYQSNPQKAKAKEISPISIPDPKMTRALNNLREESRPGTPKKAEANTSATATVSATPKSAPSPSSSSASTAKQKLQKILPTNHILPNFDSCYRRLNQPSIFCQITKIFKSQPPISKKHLYLTPIPPRVKKAVAIGVHGFFPMRLVRTVLGEPTGTSIRFANSAAAAIKRWAEKNGVEVEIEKIALEGEGKVGDRVEMLWKLLANWMDHVKSADFVLMAAHSQGVVVGVQLLARLIEEGCVDKARVGFTAMAGINLGPFYHLPTTILTGSAKELFEFQRLESIPSKKYIQSLRICLAQNVRILYVGSIDDQLVPLESSTFSNISHPYISRAVFVDGRVHAPDFLSHLVGFAMKLRNLGISDHGLVRELSSPLAGSLYGGEGHSRIYDDNAVYDLGVRHALETTDCPDVPLKLDIFELPSNNNNPFLLPWSMRGMLEEPYVRSKLEGECAELLEQFENWKPTSKVLKDVKFRLEGIRSKL